MNSRVVKNFTLEIKTHKPKEFGDIAYRCLVAQLIIPNTFS